MKQELTLYSLKGLYCPLQKVYVLLYKILRFVQGTRGLCTRSIDEQYSPRYALRNLYVFRKNIWILFHIFLLSYDFQNSVIVYQFNRAKQLQFSCKLNQLLTLETTGDQFNPHHFSYLCCLLLGGDKISWLLFIHIFYVKSHLKADNRDMKIRKLSPAVLVLNNSDCRGLN